MVNHQLHHRPECDDIRSAYGSDRSWPSDQESDLSYQRSQSSSHKSYQTQSSTYSNNSSSRRPPRVHHKAFDGDEQPARCFFLDRTPQESPNASVETYASTVESKEELGQEDTLPDYSVPQYTALSYDPRAIPATPSDFSELFPSHRKLTIRHDDSTPDGNMNLRLDTEVIMHGGRRCDMTLFHLRMHDLRIRDFSLRRYCRDSGREVCHSVRKQSRSSTGRQTLQRSLSNALNTMRAKSEHRKSSTSALRRNDSGYASTKSSIDFDRDDRTIYTSGTEMHQLPMDPNSVKLEFSNYAQVQVTRVGKKASKRYGFEYWGTSYVWRRVVPKDSTTRAVSYHLTKDGSQKALAYITPFPLTHAEVRNEQNKGGWVPPCSLWIAEEKLIRGQKDVADVVVASGLIALVDDSIRAYFHAKESRSMTSPSINTGTDLVGPKRLINGMFRRGSSGTHSRQVSANLSPVATRRT